MDANCSAVEFYPKLGGNERWATRKVDLWVVGYVVFGLQGVGCKVQDMGQTGELDSSTVGRLRILDMLL